MKKKRAQNMTQFRGTKEAFGKPGIDPRWTQGNKEAVGTAYSGDSLLWFTMFKGCVTEVYYPTIDTPQLRDLQFLISDGKHIFREEKRHLQSQIEYLNPAALQYRLTNTDQENHYKIIKEIISSPHLPCLLQKTRIEGDPNILSTLHFYVLCAPHLQIGGKHNNAYVVEVAGRQILVAEKEGIWLALGATVPFSKLSCGYVGFSDGWTDLSDNYHMDWEFDQALDGNVALTGEIQEGQYEFTLGLGFGVGLQNAISVLFQGLGIPFEAQSKRYVDQWTRASKRLHELDSFSHDKGRLYRASNAIILAQEDKTFPGALIASLSIPWGEVKGDFDLGGYHLVWTRDLYQMATGLLAAGNKSTPLRTLIYLAASQMNDGAFTQNFWVNGKPYAEGFQLDEVAFPILLADCLRQENALELFDPSYMVMKAACYLIQNGPITHQDRWEEMSGYSPATLANTIAALIVAAHFSRLNGEEKEAQYLEDYADFLETYVEWWTVTTDGTLDPDVKSHYIRINPADPSLASPFRHPNESVIFLPNQKPGTRNEFPAKEIVDAGFLELVRYGIRNPDDPLIVNSLRVIDKVLKFDTPRGPSWKRYNHDGYGQKADGSAFQGYGVGGGWPLLTGERGHYELAAGHDVSLYIQTMENFAGERCLLPEQVWLGNDLPAAHMFLGHSTGAARPLGWAHAEYIKLLRSVADGQVYDLIPQVAERYSTTMRKGRQIAIWRLHHQISYVKPHSILRIQAKDPFRLRWTANEWLSYKDQDAQETVFDLYCLDLPVEEHPIRFTFFWLKKGHWEGKDYLTKIIKI